MTIGLYAQVEQQSDRAAADQLGSTWPDAHLERPPEPVEWTNRRLDR
ncbi:MAG: hypothetical protein ABSD78_14100 [Acidimicrobiales bacterium]